MDDAAKSVNDDLTLRIWDGDESILGELLISHGASIERAIANQFPRLAADAEDIVAESYRKFWNSRDRYDGTMSLRTYLFKIAVNVARDLASGHLRWQKSRNLERHVDDQWLKDVEQKASGTESTLDAIEATQTGICEALCKSMNCLSAIERAVIEAYAAVDGVELNAGALGLELGKKLCDGVPIPAGTIRQHKFRGKSKLVAEMRKLGHELENIGVRR